MGYGPGFRSQGSQTCALGPKNQQRSCFRVFLELDGFAEDLKLLS